MRRRLFFGPSGPERPPVTTHVSGIQLTDEQIAILKTCPAVDDENKERLVRVTAAAGAGKTSTLVALALRAVELGHDRITYLKFNKAAAEDGRRRILAATAHVCLDIDALTFTACALRALQESKVIDNVPPLKDEKTVKKWLTYKSQSNIDAFLTECYASLDLRLPTTAAKARPSARRVNKSNTLSTSRYSTFVARRGHSKNTNRGVTVATQRFLAATIIRPVCFTATSAGVSHWAWAAPTAVGLDGTLKRLCACFTWLPDKTFSPLTFT